MKSAVPIARLEDHLGYWLRHVSNLVSHSFSQKLAKLDVTVAEWVVLRELYDAAERNPSDLATRLGLTRGAISKLADRLIMKSLVSRSFSTSDKRYQTLSLSTKGRGLVPKLSALADKNDEEFFGQLKPSDRAVVERAMKQIIDASGIRTIPLK